MTDRSFFFDDWIQSLREHYMYVVQNQDKATERSLTQVMLEIGFTEDELRQLYIQATMHSDDLPDDFQPDMNILEPEPTFSAHPAECTCPSCVPVDEAGHDEEGQPLEQVEEEGEAGGLFATAEIEDSAEDSDESDVDDLSPPPADAPKQLSLF